MDVIGFELLFSFISLASHVFVKSFGKKERKKKKKHFELISLTQIDT